MQPQAATALRISCCCDETIEQKFRFLKFQHISGESGKIPEMTKSLRLYNFAEQLFIGVFKCRILQDAETRQF